MRAAWGEATVPRGPRRAGIPRGETPSAFCGLEEEHPVARADLEAALRDGALDGAVQARGTSAGARCSTAPARRERRRPPPRRRRGRAPGRGILGHLSLGTSLRSFQRRRSRRRSAPRSPRSSVRPTRRSPPRRGARHRGQELAGGDGGCSVCRARAPETAAVNASRRPSGSPRALAGRGRSRPAAGPRRARPTDPVARAEVAVADEEESMRAPLIGSARSRRPRRAGPRRFRSSGLSIARWRRPR